MKEILYHSIDLGSHISGMLCSAYVLAHIILPHETMHPMKVELSCKEKGCNWAKTYRDRSRGDKMSVKLLDKMRAAHKEHFEKAHPDQEWPG